MIPLSMRQKRLVSIYKKIFKDSRKILIKYVDVTVVVNEAISEYYKKDYGIKPVSILNVPKFSIINEEIIFVKNIKFRLILRFLFILAHSQNQEE